MIRANQEIRDAIQINRLKFWEVAASLGVCPETLTRWMRTELPEDKRRRVEDVIKGLLADGNEGH